MTILFRYMLREYCKVFTMCFAGLMTVYLVVDFFEKVRRFIRYDAKAHDILLYFSLITPNIFFQMAPLAVLMATLLTLGVFSKNHEITAMRSCGISLYRMASPFLFFSLVVALVLFLFSAVIIPLSTTKAEFVKTALIEKKSSPPTFKADRPWIQIRNQTLMSFAVVDPDGATLRGVRLYHLGPDFRLTGVTEAMVAHYTPQGWVLVAGIHRRLLPDGGLLMTDFETKPIELSQIPEDFNMGLSAGWLSVGSEQMTLVDIRAYADRLRKDGYSAARFLTDYYGRVAFPFVSLVMVIVGVALSLMRSGVRGRGMAMGIGQALVIGLLYWTTHSIAIKLGYTSVLTPVVAGWFANGLFLSFGLYLILKVRY
ncbi:MAG TPA: LptF/LptG family permease [Nitrospiraceae bacterium]|nr:LptF/LptG family permease [Nitrospiraceae bacterium]